MPATNYIMVEDRRTLRHSAFSGIVPGPPDHPSLVAFSHIYPSSHRREVLSLLFTFWPLVILCPVHTENTQATAQPKNPLFQPQSETQKKGGESQSLKAFKDQTQMRKWSAPLLPHILQIGDWGRLPGPELVSLKEHIQGYPTVCSALKADSSP